MKVILEIPTQPSDELHLGHIIKIADKKQYEAILMQYKEVILINAARRIGDIIQLLEHNGMLTEDKETYLNYTMAILMNGTVLEIIPADLTQSSASH